MENSNRLNLGKILVIVVIIAVVGGAGWYGWQHFKTKNSDTNAKTSLGDGWAEYSSTQYGFKFLYLKDWGEPKITAESSPVQSTMAGAPKITKHSGTKYTITFQGTTSTDTVSAVLDSIDYSIQTCLGTSQCQVMSAFTKSDIQKVLSLSGNQVNFEMLKKDSNSYASLNYFNKSGVMTISQILNLPKIKASAANITYTRVNLSSRCENNKFPSDPSSNCISSKDYDDLNYFAKSIQKS